MPGLPEDAQPGRALPRGLGLGLRLSSQEGLELLSTYRVGD